MTLTAEQHLARKRSSQLRSNTLSPAASPTGRRAPGGGSVYTTDRDDFVLLSQGSFGNTPKAGDPLLGAPTLTELIACRNEQPDALVHPENSKDLLLSVGICEVPMLVENSVSAFIQSLVQDATANPVQPRALAPPRRVRQYHAFPRASFRTGEKCAEAGLFATSFLDTGNHQARTGILDVLENNCSRQLMKRVRLLLDDVNLHGLPVPARGHGSGASGHASRHPDPDGSMFYEPSSAMLSDSQPRDKLYSNRSGSPPGGGGNAAARPAPHGDSGNGSPLSTTATAGSKFPSTTLAAAGSASASPLTPRTGPTFPASATDPPPPALPHIDTKLWVNVICDIAWKTVSQTVADGDAQIMSHVDIVACLAGGDVADIEFVPGIVVIQHIASKKMASHVDRPRILLLGGDVGTHTNLVSDFYEYTQTYPGSLEKFYQRLLIWKPTLILVERSVHHFLQTKISSNAKMTLVTSVPRFLLERIARHCGARIIDDLGMVSMAELQDPRQSPLGSCTSFQMLNVSNRPVLMLSGLPQQTFTTIILRGAEAAVLSAIRYVLYIAIATAYHLALQTHYFVDFNGILAQMADNSAGYDPTRRKASADATDAMALSHNSQTGSHPDDEEGDGGVSSGPAGSPLATAGSPALLRATTSDLQGIAPGHGGGGSGGGLELCPELLTMNMGVQFPDSVYAVSRVESQLLRDNIIVNAIFLDPQSYTSAIRQHDKQASSIAGPQGDLQPQDPSANKDDFVVVASASSHSDIRKQRQVYDFYQAGDRTLLDFLLKRVAESSNSTRIVVHGKKQLFVRTMVEVRDLFDEASGVAGMEQFYSSQPSESPRASDGRATTASSAQPLVSIAAVRISESLSHLFLSTMRGASACAAMQRAPMCCTTCKECLRNPNNARSATTLPFPVSPHTLSLSFGSFLEMSIYASENCISTCGHRLHDDFIRKFIFYPTDGTQVTIAFEVERLKLGEIVGPPKSMCELQPPSAAGGAMFPSTPSQPQFSDTPATPDVSSPTLATLSTFGSMPTFGGPGEAAFALPRSSEEMYFADELAETRLQIQEFGNAIKVRSALPQHLFVPVAGGGGGGTSGLPPLVGASPMSVTTAPFSPLTTANTFPAAEPFLAGGGGGGGTYFRESKDELLLVALAEVTTTKMLQKFRQLLLFPAIDEYLATINSPSIPADRRAAIRKLFDMQRLRPLALATNSKFLLRLNEPTNIIFAVLTEMQEREHITEGDQATGFGSGQHHQRTFSTNPGESDGGFQRMLGQALRSVTGQGRLAAAITPSAAAAAAAPSTKFAAATAAGHASATKAASAAQATTAAPHDEDEDGAPFLRTPQLSNTNTPTSSRSTLGTDTPPAAPDSSASSAEEASAAPDAFPSAPSAPAGTAATSASDSANPAIVVSPSTAGESPSAETHNLILVTHDHSGQNAAANAGPSVLHQRTTSDAVSHSSDVPMEHLHSAPDEVDDTEPCALQADASTTVVSPSAADRGSVGAPGGYGASPPNNADPAVDPPEANETIEHIAGSEGVSNAFVRDNFMAEEEALELLLGKKKTSQTTFKYVFRDLSTGDDNLKQTLTVEVLFPHQFAALRFLYTKSTGGIEEFLLSLSRCNRFNTDGGKTKSDFFVTGDKRYMLKQIKQRELKHFFAFGPSYFQHMARFFASSGAAGGRAASEGKAAPNGPSSSSAYRTHSVLVKIFGIFSIQLKKKRAALGGDIKYYMLMENLLFRRNVDLMFDLKGSQRNRTAVEGSSVMLDQDLVRENKRGHFFFCTEEDRSWVTDTLAADATLLAQCDIMDYSLVVGVEHHSRREQLVVGIIDFLHPYTGAKIIESNMKRGLDVVFGPAGARDPTIIEPAQYRERFLRWMSAYFCDVPDKVSQIRRLASAQQKKEKKQASASHLQFVS